LPTFTPAPLIAAPPTLPPLNIAATPTIAVIAPAAPSDPNNCLKPLNLAEAGPAKNIVVQNQTQSTVNVSLNLYKPNSFGQCGSLSFQLAKGGTRTVKAASGYWYAFAWVLDPPSQVGVNFVINPGPAAGGKIVITKDKVLWLGQ
jgi:hypothetical protein